jgi:hypothetical protein
MIVSAVKDHSLYATKASLRPIMRRQLCSVICVASNSATGRIAFRAAQFFLFCCEQEVTILRFEM